MIKVGNRVSLFHDMGKTGTVVGMYPEKSKQWTVGATMEHIFIIQIKLDKDGTVEDHRADTVMRID